MLDRYFFDMWLCLYKFSKFMKTGVNLCVPNWWMAQLSINYVMKYQPMYQL